MLVLFQNLQLVTNPSYSLLNMTIEIKAFIYADTKMFHCISNINDSAIKLNREMINIGSERRSGICLD